MVPLSEASAWFFSKFADFWVLSQFSFTVLSAESER